MQTIRESFYRKEDILAEITKRGKNSALDYVTFVGDGEPTLCKDLGWLIRQTKEQLQLRTAVITNGSLLFRRDVRQDLKDADIVMPTLDAGNEKAFRAVNRPHRSIAFDTMLQGLIDFRHEYRDQIWLEIMLVKGLNDTEEELLTTKSAVDAIEPDRVYIVTPIRPPAESWVRPSPTQAILTAQEMIGKATPVTELESGEFGLHQFSDARQAIIETGSRHPLRRQQAIEIEEAFMAPGTLTQMLEAGELLDVEYNGETYLLPSCFARGESRS